MKTRTFVLLAILLTSACLSKNQKISNQPSTKNQKVDKSKISLANTIYQTTLAKGVDAGIAQFDELKNSEDYYLLEEEMNRVGFALFQSEKEKDAFAIFKFNEKIFPKTGIALAPSILAKIAQDGLEEGLKWFEKVRYSKDYYLKEREMDIAGRTFLQMGKVTEAIALFKINAEVHLVSRRAYESLGEGYLANGENDLAKKYFKKSTEVNPKNSFLKQAFQPATTYTPTILPTDTMKLFDYRGDLDNDTVFIFSQGGPLLEHDIGDYDPFIFMPNYKNLLRVFSFQSQMLNPDLVAAEPTLNRIQAAFEHQQSAEILYRIISFFKNRGKTVFVIGHSYGTMVSLRYLESRKNIADKIIISGTSLDVDPRNYQAKNKNNLVRWKDGIEPYEKSLFENMPAKIFVEDRLNSIFGNLHSLVGTHGKNQFTQLLKDKNLSNLIFIHGTFDESSGRTKPYVLDFLKSKNAKVVETYGDHHSMFSKECMTNLYHHLAHQKPLKKSVAATLAHAIEETGLDHLPNYKDKKIFHPINENEINSLGYQLIKGKKIKEAIAIFEINVSSFPKSSNAYDSLGEAYLLDKNKTLAKKNYEKSVELNPNNQNAIKILKDISGK